MWTSRSMLCLPKPQFCFSSTPVESACCQRLWMGSAARSCHTPRPLYIAYVAPTPEQEHLFASAGFLEKICENIQFKFCLYRGGS